ncbi:thioredoxin domain-containing protein [Lacisediminihabitans sp. H27-G8]|uniref:thioredoxin domain-containing protein n=1 Tax=Lacisediminihabitans sp. H27-G8 TaxID=3111909 RepID=UPI0038FC4971
MADRLADAVSPYLRSHVANPVDWFPWGDEPFAEARRRDVPVLVSIGYSTCHWCHVMSRETFSDPVIASRLAADFVAVKVDREEHPDVDASYLAAAGAFTGNLGWPLNVFVTPEGKAFYAGTYWPPTAVGDIPSFGQVLDAVADAWTARRPQVESTAAAIADALRQPADGHTADSGEAGTGPLDSAVAELLAYEDSEFGGFGGAPKFPVAPVLLFLLERGADAPPALALASRALAALSGRHAAPGQPTAALRDRLEGGFFRYATKRDWTDPHFERMLYDNAQLLTAFTRLAQLDAEARDWAVEVAEGISAFLIGVMQQPVGGFASAQDSESTIDGVRREGAYFALGAAARAAQEPPPIDAKILTGWNGLAIGALATAGFALAREEWIVAARRAADAVIEGHLRADGTLVRASIGGRMSSAHATLEDYGMLASGLLDLATATGDVHYASVARSLIDLTLGAAGSGVFGVPGGADPVLVAQGTAIENDPSEGAYPSGLSSMARASVSLHLLGGDPRYREAADRVVRHLLPLAVPRPVSFGATLAVASALSRPIAQLVVVSEDPKSDLADLARSRFGSGLLSIVVTPAQTASFAKAGFELFEGRDREAAYLCRDFVCRLPVVEPRELAEALDLLG